MTTNKPSDGKGDEGSGALPALLQRTLHEAEAAAREGNLSAALAAFDEAPASLHAFATFHYARGALLVRARRFDEGIAALSRALELEPDVPEMKGNLGGAYLERVYARGPTALAGEASQRDLQEALALLEEATRARPHLPDVYSNFGRALSLSGRDPEALLAFERALALDGAHVPTLYNKAATLHRLGRDEDALACLDALLAVSPDFEPAKQSRENTLRRLGRA